MSCSRNNIKCANPISGNKMANDRTKFKQVFFFLFSKIINVRKIRALNKYNLYIFFVYTMYNIRYRFFDTINSSDNFTVVIRLH